MWCRRTFLKGTGIAFAGAWVATGAPPPGSREAVREGFTRAKVSEWMEAWERAILSGARRRYCDTETGEELGWLMSPFLSGYASAFAFTGEDRWMERLSDWSRAWLERGVVEPDGQVGWPKRGSGGSLEQGYRTDSLLGEAMAFRPLVSMAARIQRDAAWKKRWGMEAGRWVEAAERCFAKWEARGAWREVALGGVWVVPEFGLEDDGKQWTKGYERRMSTGFTHPANKQNHIARSLLALYRATGREVYRDRAAAWWRVMKSRIRRVDEGRRWVWNYWDPAGPWDYEASGKPRHWVGVHPNGGYYGIDVEGIVEAFEHGLVFERADLDSLVTTQLDFMWDGRVKGAKFSRLDGGPVDSGLKDSPGVLWTALAPYSAKLRELF